MHLKDPSQRDGVGGPGFDGGILPPYWGGATGHFVRLLVETLAEAP